MSSSAALELATAMLIASACHFKADALAFAKIARAAENDFVGVPCGILDQGVSAFGKSDHLVGIDCRTHTFNQLPLPGGLAFWIFNTGKKHSLVDSLYSKRHAECTEALQILTKIAQSSATCLSDFDASAIESAKEALPTDLYQRALHVVTENARVDAVHAALEMQDLPKVGQCLFESHKSSRDQFKNSIPELDFLVDILQQTPGVFGARLTGGGFGGAVMALTNATFTPSDAFGVANRYHEEFGHTPTLLHTKPADGARSIKL